MDTIKAQTAPLEKQKAPQSLNRFWKKGAQLHISGLQVKLILPYVVLTLAMALVGIFFITSIVAGDANTTFHNGMLDASRVANDGMVSQEKNQLDKLRFVIFTDGMGQAIYDQNSDQIFNLMRPILANSNINLITAIGTDGREIVTFGRDPITKTYQQQKNLDFSGVSAVRKVLNKTTDSQGDKFSELLILDQKPILITAAPILDANQQTVGAMLVGTYLNDILDELKKQSLADVILLDSQRKFVATTLNGNEEGFLNLISLGARINASDKTQTQDITLNKWPFQVAYSPLKIRGQQVGWVGVLKNSYYILNQKTKSRDLFIVIFSIGTIMVVFTGYGLAQNIARPILRLRSMSQSVAAGDLDQNIGLRRSDEIGELAKAFDVMTSQLRERTEEAERLYAESLQRNKELAEINARLESTQLQLIQSEKLAAIGQLTAGIVHDVKNPFAVIMGMAEILSEGETLDEETRQGLRVVREAAVKGNTIVSDLLKFARQSKPEMQLADLRETIKTAMRLTAYLTRRYDTTVELSESPILLTYDSQLIEQVLINMIHNAVQAMPNKGMLRIALNYQDDTALISIQDSGDGIAPEHIQRIFDPFFTTKPEGKGTGLGLSVSYGIIANHHGRIDVESELGKGTTFTIVLPITQPSLSSGEH